MGMEVAKESFAITEHFPAEERFGLTSQVNRAAVSIPANIAEGCGRNSDKDFNRFLQISLGSCYELSTLLELAFMRKFIEQKEFDRLQEILTLLMKSIASMSNKLQ